MYKGSNCDRKSVKSTLNKSSLTVQCKCETILKKSIKQTYGSVTGRDGDFLISFVHHL